MLEARLQKPVGSTVLAFLDNALPVTVAELKAHSRIEHSLEDALLEQYIAAALHNAELQLQQKIRRQQVQLVFESFDRAGCCETGLLLSGCGSNASVSSVTYNDENGVLITLSASEYRVVNAQQKYIVPRSPSISSLAGRWPRQSFADRQVTVVVECGFSLIPAPVKQWVLMMAGTLYNMRESAAEKPMAQLEFVDHLLDPYRLPIL
ncbi:MAG TPA: hypothetical protein DCF63_05695 [Planctomycetaceae bacterium]|nr:hypothetical protein [Planctomycetaceae bacterium]